MMQWRLWSIFLKKTLGFFRTDAFMEIIIHQADWRGAAGREALGKLNRKTAARRYADWVVMRIGVRSVDACEFAEFVHELVRAAHRARMRATDANMEFPWG